VNPAFGNVQRMVERVTGAWGRPFTKVRQGFGSPTFLILFAGLIAASAAWLAAWAGEEPPALNPFAPVRQDREDAVPGYLEMSDGRVFVGTIYMTRDKRLKIEDDSLGLGGEAVSPKASEKRQREIPLRAIRQIEAKVEKEWMEKEWRFKESALDEKVYTGRAYPARKYVHTVTLHDGRKITGPVAEIFYVQPLREPASGPRSEEDNQPLRFMIHKRDKGEPGATLQELAYVKLIKLGNEAVEEGKKKALRMRNAPSKGTKKTSTQGKRLPTERLQPSEAEPRAAPTTENRIAEGEGPPVPAKKARRNKLSPNHEDE